MLNIDQDFWTPERQILYKDEFQNNVESKVMWSLYLIHHPESEFYDLDLSSKQSIVASDYLGDTAFDFTLYAETVQKILTSSLSKPKRSMYNWELKLEERDAFIASVPYNSDTFEMLDKMMSQTDKLWAQYFSIKKQMEKDEGTALGGSEESLSDKGII